MSVVTDQANAFEFETNLETNFAADTLGRAKKTYYDQWDTDKDHPVIRDGHLWSVRRKPPKTG